MHRTAVGLPRRRASGASWPELDEPDIRELPAYSRRLIYQLREQRVFILAVIHKRRQPSGAELAPG